MAQNQMLSDRNSWRIRPPARGRGRIPTSAATARASDRTRSSCEVSAISEDPIEPRTIPTGGFCPKRRADCRKPHPRATYSSRSRSQMKRASASTYPTLAPARRDASTQRRVERLAPFTIMLDGKFGGLQASAARKLGAYIGVADDRRYGPRDVVCVVRVDQQGGVAGDLRQRGFA